MAIRVSNKGLAPGLFRLEKFVEFQNIFVYLICVSQIVFISFLFLYSGDLKSDLVWISNGP